MRARTRPLESEVLAAMLSQRCHHHPRLRSARLPLRAAMAIGLVAGLSLLHTRGIHGMTAARADARAETSGRRSASPAGPAGPAEAAHIRNLIHQLAGLDHVDFGQSYFGWDQGIAFAPLPSRSTLNPFKRPDNRDEVYPAFAELVRLGPRALPYLLQSMEDPTPTHLPYFTGLIVSIMHAVPPLGNRANAREAKILNEQNDALREIYAARRAGKQPPFKTHSPYGDAVLRRQEARVSWSDIQHRDKAVTVGDVCLIAVGQITGRDYQHLCFFGDGRDSVVPLEYASITPEALRAIWQNGDDLNKNLDKHLHESQLLDFHSRDSDDVADTSLLKEHLLKGQLFPSPALSDKWQVSAAQRLLYYYPRDSVALITARLDGLNVSSRRNERRPKDSWRDSNGVAPAQFIQAVAWSREPAVRAAVRRIFQRSDDYQIRLACLPALDADTDWPLVSRWLFSHIPKRDDNRASPGDDDVLLNLRDFGGDRALPLFRQYRDDHRTIAGVEAVIQVLMARNDGTWDREFLLPLLSDKRTSTWTAPITLLKGQPESSMRLCDLAANVIAWHRGDRNYTLPATEPERDAQIAKIRASLSK